MPDGHRKYLYRLLTFYATVKLEHSLEVLEVDLLRPLFRDQELERVLRGLALVQEESPELVLLNPGEGVIHHSQHEVHQEIQVH